MQKTLLSRVALGAVDSNFLNEVVNKIESMLNTQSMNEGLSRKEHTTILSEIRGSVGSVEDSAKLQLLLELLGVCDE